MAKLRLGIIGAGSWTVASHLPNFAKRRDDVEFVGVARKGKELLQKIKNDWGFQVASEDYRDVVDAGMDICLVASPHGLHYEHAKAALDAPVEHHDACVIRYVNGSIGTMSGASNHTGALDNRHELEFRAVGSE